MPVIAYPTETFKEISTNSNNAVVLTDTFAYYELARELQSIDVSTQIELSKAYAKDMAWPKMAAVLADLYQTLLG